MKFEKKMVYLGYSSMRLSRDNSLMHTVSFFDTDVQATVSVNVMDSNADVSSVLPSLSFGFPTAVTFSLRPGDKNQYRLALAGLSPIPPQ